MNAALAVDGLPFLIEQIAPLGNRPDHQARRLAPAPGNVQSTGGVVLNAIQIRVHMARRAIDVFAERGPAARGTVVFVEVAVAVAGGANANLVLQLAVGRDEE